MILEKTKLKSSRDRIRVVVYFDARFAIQKYVQFLSYSQHCFRDLVA